MTRPWGHDYRMQVEGVLASLVSKSLNLAPPAKKFRVRRMLVRQRRVDLSDDRGALAHRRRNPLG